MDTGELEPPPHDFWFRGGCTVLVDLDRGEVRYCIGKGIANEDRLERQRRFVNGDSDGSLDGHLLRRPQRARRSRAVRAPAPLPDEPEEIEEQTPWLLRRTPTMTAPDSGVTVRMYRQGLGDCFLLAFATRRGAGPVSC